MQTVIFEKPANAFESSSKAESSLRRIQRFVSTFIFESDLIEVLIFNILPDRSKLTLTIDRSNWQFGQTDINIFMSGIAYDGVAFPLLKCYPKERIATPWNG